MSQTLIEPSWPPDTKVKSLAIKLVTESVCETVDLINFTIEIILIKTNCLLELRSKSFIYLFS
jgi:hypothetical protein